MSDSDYTTARSGLTFSQAAGIDPLPQPAKLGELPWDARNALWSRLFHGVRKDSYGEILESLDEPWDSILYDFHISVMKRTADEFDVRLRIQLPAIKDLILNGPYNRVFDFLQFIVRHSLVPDGFGAFVAATLHECSCAYSLTTIEGVWTIMPTAIPEQRISVEKALRVLTDGPFGGAREHLRKSVDCINTGDYSGSVRESIHASRVGGSETRQQCKNSIGGSCLAGREGISPAWRVQERDQAIIRLCKR